MDRRWNTPQLMQPPSCSGEMRPGRQTGRSSGLSGQGDDRWLLSYVQSLLQRCEVQATEQELRQLMDNARRHAAAVTGRGGGASR